MPTKHSSRLSQVAQEKLSILYFILYLFFVQVEKNVTVVSKALVKAGRFFEANGLERCSKIAKTVKDQVNTCLL